jgi:hypothetical protein
MLGEVDGIRRQTWLPVTLPSSPFPIFKGIGDGTACRERAPAVSERLP